MNMNDRHHAAPEHLTERLDTLNEHLRRQLSIWYVFRNGVMYGAGFIIGSTILTAVVVTILLNLFGGTELGDVLMWFARER